MKAMNGTLQKKTKRLPHRAFVVTPTYYRMCVNTEELGYMAAREETVIRHLCVCVAASFPGLCWRGGSAP